MKALIFASLVFGTAAFAESDFFGLPVTPAPPPPTAADLGKAVGVIGKWMFMLPQGERKVTIFPDGRVAYASGEDSGRWTLEREFLVLHWSDGTQHRVPLTAAGNRQKWDALAPGSKTWTPGDLVVIRIAEPAPALPLQSGPALEIKASVDRFAQEFAKLSAAEATALAPVTGAYVKELEKAKEAATARTDLDAALAAEAAIQAARKGRLPLPSKVPVPAIEQLRANYEKARIQALHLYEPQRSRLEADYERTMNELEQRYIRAGNVEAAHQVRVARLSAPVGVAVDVLPLMAGEHESRDGYCILKGDDLHLRTESTFQPPLEIEYVFKTDGQIRFGYACDQFIFNWELNRSELRIDGGPASGQHRPGAGSIPTKQMLTVKQVVLPDQMILSVDGHERARWSAKFSGVDEAIELWPVQGSTIWLKQVIVRKLP